MGKSSRHINGVILGDPSGTSSDPIGEKEGQAYWNDTLQKFRYFNGVVWGDLGYKERTVSQRRTEISQSDTEQFYRKARKEKREDSRSFAPSFPPP
jgi:hypothetical protein